MPRYRLTAGLLTMVWFLLLSSQARAQDDFTLSALAMGLEHPWEVTWGPDDHLWVTERTAFRVTRVNPIDGSQQVAATVPGVFQSVAQDGLLGLALHPRLMEGSGEAYVYVAFTYQDVTDVRLKVRRYSYDPSAGQLDDPLDVITGLPAHDDHLGGRLAIGPDEKLYLSIGDQGGNWLHNFCNPNLAQELPTAAQIQAGDWTTYEGTILRLNLDGSIPGDNPVLDGVRSHVLSYGHRNPQGLAFADDGRLYASEHGPSTDDELNLIQAGGNYGWPQIAGYQDDQMYVYANWSAGTQASCASLSFSQSQVPASVPQETEASWSHPNFRPPLQTLFTVPSNYDFDAQGGATIAPSSLAIYTARDGGIPGWADSLLVPGLIKGRMYRQSLSSDGTTAAGEPIELFRTTNRYRDLALHPNGRTIYVATDSSGRTTGADGTMTQALEHPGAIIQFTYEGSR